MPSLIFHLSKRDETLITRVKRVRVSKDTIYVDIIILVRVYYRCEVWSQITYDNTPHRDYDNMSYNDE